MVSHARRTFQHVPLLNPRSKEYADSFNPCSVLHRDFDAPGNLATADTSSGGIAATALINIAAIERSLGNTTGSDYYVKSAANVSFFPATVGDIFSHALPDHFMTIYRIHLLGFCVWMGNN